MQLNELDESQSISNSDLSLNNLPSSSNGPSTTTLLHSITPHNKPLQENRLVKLFHEYVAYFKALLVALLISGLKASGPIPTHVAIIMDGNRRFAKKKKFSHVSEGHFEGAKTLEKLLDYGFRLGVKSVTVYAFSIENFKRPAEEVDVLMSLAAEKLQILSQKSELIKKHRVRINVLGALHLLPRHVQISAAEAMLTTIKNEDFILNICFPYTSTHEITEACKLALNYTRSEPDPLPVFDDLSLFDCFLDTWDSPPLEILVRTSGEARLSEFLMWQVCRQRRRTGDNSTSSSAVQVHILDALWPEFSFKHLLPIIIKYQSSNPNPNVIINKNKPNKDVMTLMEWRMQKKIEYLTKIVNQ